MSTLADPHLDRYPSRVASESSLEPRQDPVVHPSLEEAGPGPLTPEQLAAFDRDGFLVLEGAFSEAEAAAWLDELHALGRRPDIRDSAVSIIEPERDEVRSIFEVHRRSDVFAALAADPRLVEAARQILGSDVYVHQSRVNLKPAMRGKEFFWHSDFETWHVEDGMPAMRAVSASIALTENTEFNGPLMVVPGSHRRYVTCVGETPEKHYEQSLRRQDYGVPDLESLTRLVDEGGIVAPKGPAGMVVLFDCNTMHGSGVNLSPQPRSNAFFVFNSVENQLVPPFSGQDPRPEHIATREHLPG